MMMFRRGRLATDVAPVRIIYPAVAYLPWHEDFSEEPMALGTVASPTTAGLPGPHHR
jgi:hypothetical protein